MGSIIRAALVLVALSSPATAQSVGHVWTRHADIPVPRFEGPTLPIDGKLYVFGGYHNAQIQVTPRVDVYDPLVDTWSRLSDMPLGVTHLALARAGRKLWVLGGFVGNNPGVASSQVWVYDIDLDTWTPGPALPHPIAAGGAKVIGTRLHYYSGVEADRNTNTGDHWVLDLNAPQSGWIAAAPMPQPRCHFATVELGGLIYVLGGQVRHDFNPVDTAFVHVFDPVTGAWTEGPPMPAPRSHAESGTYVQDGKIYVSGGNSSTQQQFALSDVAVFDPATQRWSYGVPLALPRHSAGVQLLGDRVYIVAGATRDSAPQVDVFSRHKDAVMPNPIRINVGGDEYTSPFDGRVWTGDFLTDEGEQRAYPGAPVLATNDPELFRAQRRGAGNVNPNRVRYRWPVGPGMVRCRCHFADLDSTAAGQRVFDIRVEGVTLAHDIDPVGHYGQRVAFSRAFDVRVADDELEIEFSAGMDRPTIAALELEVLAPDHYAQECTSLVNSTGARARLGFIGSTSIADDALLLVATSVPTNTLCILLQGASPWQQSIPGGVLCVGQPQFRHGASQAVGQTVHFELVPSQPPTPAAQITAGSTWRFQGWFRDGGAAPPWGFTDGLKLVFTP